MKTTKIIIAVMLALLFAISLISCGDDDIGANISEGDIKVTVQISSDEYGLLVEGEVGLSEGASVLDAITAYCASPLDKNGDGKDTDEIPIEYTSDENGNPMSVSKLGDYKETIRSKLNYYWSFMLNGKEPVGRAAENIVKDGDVVTYNYTFIPTGEYVTIRFEAEGKELIKSTVIVFDEGDTVLDVAAAALRRSAIEYNLNEDRTAIEYIGEYLAKVTPIYDESWDASVNGEAVVANEALAVNESEIVFTFNRVEKEYVEGQM